MTRLSIILALSLALTLSAFGCTPSKSKAGAGAKSTSRTTGVVNLALESGDQMKYDKAQLSVQKNKRVKLTLKHTGKMKKEVMGHNFVLLKKDVDVQKFAVAAIAAKENGYIPAELKGDIIAHTKLLGGGESDTIEFDAPEPGTYVFICTFPGHYAVMKGEFVVT